MAAVNSMVDLDIRRVASNESGSSSSSRDVCSSKSFWDVDAYGVDSLVSLHSPDEEGWTNSQVSCSLNTLKLCMDVPISLANSA